jgi:enamine deaminase RidA (YjgF/YER057c/UK114 family)
MTQSTMADRADVVSPASAKIRRRKSVTVEGIAHKFPVPNACRIGNLVVSSAIHGIDPATHTLPDDLTSQCTHVFANMKTIVEAAGGSTQDIIKMTLYLRDRGNRGPVNEEWVRMFPDPDARPARHAQVLLVDGPSLIQCDFIAVIESASRRTDER